MKRHTNEYKSNLHYTYSYDELNQMRVSDKYKLLIASIVDKYDTYGKIGSALIECDKDVWNIKLLLMSCRVIARGVGTIMLNHIRQSAKDMGVKLRSEFISNDRNWMMYITYGFTGFTELECKGNHILLGNDLSHIQQHPDYIKENIL